MIDVLERVVAALVVACILCLSTVKSVGVMQQGGYKNKTFWRWLKRKDNLHYNRLSVLALCLALATAVTSLCFSFLGTAWALVASAVPFFGLLLLFRWSDSKYALKVPAKRTGRFVRLWGIYFFYTALLAYILIAVLAFLSKINGSPLYALIAYVPVAVLPLLLPLTLCLANGTTAVFENAHNRKFVKRAGQVLDESQIIRVAVVGSYGKTTVKNILKTLLSEKFTVVETPASYNTPMGIAKTVLSSEFSGKQVFIAEMGARKQGDIRELCQLVKPDFAVFTGVCEQHILTFGSLENILAEKSEILRSTAKAVVCGERLRGVIDGDNVRFARKAEDVELLATRTKCTLPVGEKKLAVDTCLLSETAVENLSLAVELCVEMGMSAEEIAEGVKKLTAVPHRLQLTENAGVYVLDDGYNCNVEGAKAALGALARFEKGKCVVTPGIVEGGILEETLNARLGEEIAKGGFDKVILVGDTLVGAVKEGYKAAGGDMQKLTTVPTLIKAQGVLMEWLQAGDCVLFLNDLPDAY